MSVHVEMLETGRSTFDYTAIPEKTASWLESRGLNWILLSRDFRQLRHYRSIGFRPLFWKDLDKEVADDLETSGFAVKSDVSHGEIHSLDCVLYVRSASEKEFWSLAERQKSRNLLGQTTVDAIEEGILHNERVKGQKFFKMKPTERSGNAEQHISGGASGAIKNDPELAKAVREQLSKMNK